MFLEKRINKFFCSVRIHSITGERHVRNVTALMENSYDLLQVFAKERLSSCEHEPGKYGKI